MIKLSIAMAGTITLAAAGWGRMTEDPPVVTSFTYDQCRAYEEYNRFVVLWNVSGDTTGWGWEIWESPNSSFSPTSLRKTGTSQTSAVLGNYPHGSPTMRYFRIRYTDGITPGTWYNLQDNPLDVGICPD